MCSRTTLEFGPFETIFCHEKKSSQRPGTPINSIQRPWQDYPPLPRAPSRPGMEAVPGPNEEWEMDAWWNLLVDSEKRRRIHKCVGGRCLSNVVRIFVLQSHRNFACESALQFCCWEFWQADLSKFRPMIGNTQPKRLCNSFDFIHFLRGKWNGRICQEFIWSTSMFGYQSHRGSYEEAFPVDLVHIQWIHNRVVGLNERHG